MGITRAYFRVSEIASSQHETALVQAVSKLLSLGKTTSDKIVLFRSQALELGILLTTGVYDGGVFKNAVITRVDDRDLPLTNTVNTLVYGLPETLS